jgi:urease accessory protein
MIIAEAVLGNINDASWKDRLDGVDIDVLSLDQWEAQKNRFRRKTDGGVDLAVSLERNHYLHDGDILVWDETACKAIIARLQLQEVMVIQLQGLLSNSQESLARTCLELGHALGNQHWPAVVKETTVYVPLTVDRQVMASVMKTHAFEGITCEFAPGAEVIPYLAPHETRRLFGAADPMTETHGHAHSHPHDH